MINMLVPTDFTIQSVQAAEQCVKALDKPCNIILFHVFELPFYYQDLIRVPAPYTGLVTEKLRQACQQLKEEYSKQIGTVSFRFLQGDTQSLFKTFTTVNNIDVIGCPEGYLFSKVHKHSVNPMKLFKKCGLPLITEIYEREMATVNHSFVERLSLTAAS